MGAYEPVELCVYTDPCITFSHAAHKPSAQTESQFVQAAELLISEFRSVLVFITVSAVSYLLALKSAQWEAMKEKVPKQFI